MKLHSDNESIKSGELSLLAIVETVVAASLFVWLVSTTDSGKLFFAGALILPLGLIQTPQSKLRLRRWWRILESRLIAFAKPKWEAFRALEPVLIARDGSKVDAWNATPGTDLSRAENDGQVVANVAVLLYHVPFSIAVWVLFVFLGLAVLSCFLVLTFAFGVAATTIYVAASFLTFIKRPLISLYAIPTNYSRLCLCVDIFNEPAIIPESYQDRFATTGLLRPYKKIRPTRDSNDHLIPKWVIGRRALLFYERALSRVFDLLTFPFAFAIAIASRISVKSSSVMYGTIALLWANRVSADGAFEFLQGFRDSKLNRARAFWAGCGVLLFVTKLAIYIKFPVIHTPYARLNGLLDWFVLPESLPAWQLAGVVHAAIFLALFFGVDAGVKTIGSRESAGYRCAVFVNSCLLLLAGLSAYICICVVVLCGFAIMRTGLPELSPYFPTR
ncbi:hypothetical protein [Rhodopirellula sp. P2]|uniref:hypothetical protein n=1 Tax=Rhodopirellula sp. P2 TaxID=2127060 RepID=UPI002367C1CC|nr:hypothetical protein [Rhodopirellula sp. P2]WDQ15431.1 hypothetical protein PSR62_17515 [Rhodopirellula sp. P2]